MQGERVEYYKADLLLYKDARVDMYYLDRYVGADNWQERTGQKEMISSAEYQSRRIMASG